MPYCKKNNFLILLLFIVGTIAAQIVPSKQVSTLNGLPNNQVESIFKDSRGILWIGTNNGVSKIENGNIKNFYASDGLAHNSAWSIVEDINNTIWIGSYGGGITKFDGKKFTIFNEGNGLANNFIRKLFTYRNNVFVGTKNGLSVVHIKNNRISTFSTAHIINRDGVNGFQVMDFFVYNNELYCGTFRSGIFKINIENLTVKQVFIGDKFLFSTYLKDDNFYYSIDGNADKEPTTLLKYSINAILSNKNTPQKKFGNSIIWEYATDHHNNVYGAGWNVHTEDGGVFQLKDDTFINRSKDFGVESKNVRCLFFDKAIKRLYVGTVDKGFYEVDLNEHITFIDNNRLNCIAIEQHQENLAFLTKKGFKLVHNNKIIKHVWKYEFLEYAQHIFLQNLQYSKEIYTYLIAHKTVDEIAFYDLVLKENTYWISSFIGLFQLDLKGNFLNYYPIRTNKFEFDGDNLLKPIPYGVFDVISNLHKTKGNLEAMEYKRFGLENPHTPSNISDFIKLNDKIIISTLYKGLFIYEDKKFTSLNEVNIFKELEINHLSFIEDSNSLVVSTVSGAIYICDTLTNFNVIKVIDKTAIHGNSIEFLETYKNNILIGTNEGLTIYNNGKFQFIDHDQGLVKHELTSSKVVNDSLIIGTDTGYYILNLPKITATPLTGIRLKISDLQVNHQVFESASYNWFTYNLNELELNFNQNNIDLTFKANNYPYPAKLLYKYQFKGLDTIWSSYSTKMNISSHYLPSGTFDILVKTKDLNSGKEYETNLVALTVKLPFWKTWWFSTLLLILIALISFAIYKLRTKKLKAIESKKAETQKRLIETKLEALQSQMNPHFTFNAMNSIQNYIIDKDTDNALMYLSEFAKLIRKTLDNSNHQKISLAEEISYLTSYVTLENMRFDNKVKIHIVENNLNTNSIFLPPMLIEPFVENAFIHAFDAKHPNPTLTINFSIINNSLQCEISDNGKGMQQSTSEQLHQSKGLKLVTERLLLLNKSGLNNFNIRSNTQGTTVLLNIQLQNTND